MRKASPLGPKVLPAHLWLCRKSWVRAGRAAGIARMVTLHSKGRASVTPALHAPLPVTGTNRFCLLSRDASSGHWAELGALHPRESSHAGSVSGTCTGKAPGKLHVWSSALLIPAPGHVSEAAASPCHSSSHAAALHTLGCRTMQSSKYQGPSQGLPAPSKPCRL